jgi:hypothetical protein
LQDASQIFGVLLGQDVTLMRVDFGTLSATAGLYQRFRIMAGPVPVSILIGGQITIKGRMAMGFDTYGFGPVLSGARSGFTAYVSALIDGIYLDDFDASGADVHEIQLLAEVTVGAAVDLVIIAVGVEAGLFADFSLNFKNSLHLPPGSGKLRIKTVAANMTNPLCLFTVAGKLEAFFRLFFEINLFLFKKKFTWEPFPRIVLFQFEADICNKVPVLAGVDGSGDLWLKMGPHAGGRNVGEGEPDEKFIVRQLTRQLAPGSPAKVSVTAFNTTLEYEGVKRIRAKTHQG